MASLFDKIADIFKPKNDTQPAVQQSASTLTVVKPTKPRTTGQTAASTKQFTIPAAKQTQTPKSTDTSQTFKPAQSSIGLYNPTGLLSSRVYERDVANGNGYDNVSTAQKAYNSTYYKTIDDPTHTKMYTDLAYYSAPGGGTGEAFREKYQADHDKLETELAETKKKYGSNSNEYKALQQFIGDYEKLGARAESRTAARMAVDYSHQLDQNIQEIYGGLMSQSDFQAKAEEGKAALAKSGLRFYETFDLDYGNATDLQKNLLGYLYHEEGKKGIRQFLASGLGQLLTATSANKLYSETIGNDDRAQRGGTIGAQGFIKGLYSVAPDSYRFFQGLTGSDMDDTEDKNLGGGYTISDSTDAYLRATFAKNLEESGVTAAKFKYAAELGSAKLGSLSGSEWVTDMRKNASEYQKQVISFLCEVSGEDAAKEAWEAIKERDQLVWDATKKGSNRLATNVDELLTSMYDQYLGMGGSTPSGFLAGSEGSTWAQTLHRASISAAEQIPAWAVGNAVGGIARTAGLGAKAVATAGRVAGAVPQATMFGGRAYSEALDKGVDRGKALGYGITEASMEFITDQLLDGFGSYAGRLTGGLRDKLVAKIASPALRALTDVGIRAWGEGVQEYVQEALEPVIASVFLDEGDLKEALVGVVDPRNLLDEDRLYAGFLGALTTLVSAPGNVVTDAHRNAYYSALGKGLSKVDTALAKAADVILNNPVEGPDSNPELYEEAKKIAEIIKKGGKVSDLAAGEMIENYRAAGGDISHLANLTTMAYTKEAITLDQMVAGATSMLAELGGDVELAEDLAKVAKGQQISPEAMERIRGDKNATEVMSQLLDKLDMSQDTALTRAARAGTRNNTGNPVYDTLVGENTNQTVATPVSQQLYVKGVSWETASKVGSVIEQVMNGEEITEDEATLVAADNTAIRSVISESLGLELSEEATTEEILTALNDAAAQRAKIKADQEIVRQSARQAAEARMQTPIPPASQTQTLTAPGGVEINHDDFIRQYRDQHGVSQEEAEQAWQDRVYINGALNGQEENNGTVHGNEERRNVFVAARGAVQESTERGDRSGRPADSEGRGVPETERGSGGEDAPRYRGQKITELNSEQRDFVQDAMSDGFTSVTLIKGPLHNAKGVEVNAIAGGDGSLIIRWDNPYADPRRVERHEKIHRWLDEQKNRGAFVMNALWDIVEGNEELLNKLYKIYSQKYGKCYEGMSPNEFVEHIYEEIFADMYAGLDLYKAGTAEYEEAAQMYVMQSDLESDFFGEDHTNDYEGMDEFDLTDPFHDSTDFDLPADVRPFPGEEPGHDQLDRFSVSSMSEGTGFELKLNEAGMPYAVIDPKTGERVTNVTADMIKGTPLGKVVQMAVKSEDNPNGTITEEDAKVQYEMLADAMNLIVKYNDAAVVWELVGSQLFSAIKANSDKQYNKTIDFSTICKKTMAIVDAMSESMKRLGRGLTRREVEIVYEEVGKAGEATPCPVCYVFSRWMGIGNLLDQISNFQKKYADMDEESLVAFMKDIEKKAYDHVNEMSESKRKDFYDKRGNLKIGKAISDMKGGPNNRAAKAIEKLNEHQQAGYLIGELTKAMENATPAQAKRYQDFIAELSKKQLTQDQIDEYIVQMMEADAEMEPYEAYQWLAKTVMMADKAKINEDGEAIGSWKKNPRYNPVPNDILFDLNKGADFAEHYPLTWAFRTGKGCAMGKAIAPYSDARVGETIQGVALSDVKKIRIGGMAELQKILDDETLTKRQKTAKKGRLNEFLIGNDKKADKTLGTGRKNMRQQNLIGGMRYQSTSDFRYEFGSDYLITFFEMQALGANVQLYTKVIEAVDFLASTGADCNLSVMPRGDGYEEYTDPKTGEKKLRLVFSDITGINADAAIKKSKQYDNVQLILVGINDTNIRLALEGAEVTFVIPFHGSGQSVHQVQTLMDLIGEHLDVTQAQDYTGVQSDQFYPEPTKENRENPKRVVPLRTKEQKAMWDLRMAIIMGKCEKGLTAAQEALLAKNAHLQKLYNMFYKDSSDPAYHNYLAKDQAEHIFPYEYWDKEGNYDNADENGRIFQEYCASMGVIPRFSGINSKGELATAEDKDGNAVNYGNFTKDKGYWKLLIDRPMYENKYNEKGEWIGYGKYRAQKQINMSRVKLSDLDPKTGEAQFTNGEMSKQYDATHKPESRANRDRIVTNAIQRIEAARDNVDIFDRTKVGKGTRKTIMGAQSALRERMSVAPGPSEENTIYVKDGHYENGETINFIDAMLDGRKKGETRTHKSLTRKWVGLGKDGFVYGRVRFGEPQILRKGTQEYQDSLIEGTEYDLKDGETKYYYPVLEIEDFRDNPKPITRNGNYGRYQRYSLAPVEPVEPSSGSWSPSHTTEEAMEAYPNLWNVAAEESEKRNPTQIASTQGTYRNIYKILQKQGFDGTILDASSGLGLGTQVGREEFGFDVEDIEPYPDKSYSPMYTDYSKLNKKYDAIISSAVLNVLPQDQRDALVVKMGELLKDGGRMYITTRGKDVDSLAKTGKNIQLGPMEWIETVKGSYQKGFTQNELKAYLEDALGPNFTVELSNASNGGKFNNNTSIVVTKNGAANTQQRQTPQQRYSVMDQQHNDWAPEFYSKMERVVDDWTNGKGQPLGAKMAANQVVGWLKGKGVKSEEIKWSGIVPYLEGKKTVTKEELQQVMAENEVKIETKVLESGKGYTFWSGEEWDDVTVDGLEDLYEYGYRLAEMQDFDPEEIRIYPSKDGYYITRDDTGEILVDAKGNDAGDTHWREYVLDGGENYREILFKQPTLGGYTNRAMQVHWGEKDVIAHARVADQYRNESMGKILFIEEIQSDLHNEGAKNGFESESSADVKERQAKAKAKVDSLEKAYTDAMKEASDLAYDVLDAWKDAGSKYAYEATQATLRAWINGHGRFPTVPRNAESSLKADEMLTAMRAEDSLMQIEFFDTAWDSVVSIRNRVQAYDNAVQEYEVSKKRTEGKTPDVPFAGSSDTYHEYVMKHMLRLAAEGDYDAVAWTTAQQQSDRWSDEYAEGYRIEYDQNLPKFMNKYGKQWGAKVGSSTLLNGEEVWSVDITPEMKDSVLHEGQPRFSVAPEDLKDQSYTGGFASEAEWREAVKKDSGLYEIYSDEMKERWGFEDWRMGEMDAAMVELLDKIDEIRQKGSWYGRDITGLKGWNAYTDFINLLEDRPAKTQPRIEFMIRNLSPESLERLKWYPVKALSTDDRKAMRKSINLFNKIIDSQIKAISANQDHIGHDLQVNNRKVYSLSEIREMFEKLNDNEETGAIAQKVFDWAEEMEAAGFNIPFKFRALKDASGQQWGGKVRYDTEYFNNPDVADTRKAQTLLHELIHAYSAYAIDLVHASDKAGGNYFLYSNGQQLKRAYGSLSAEIIEAVRTLDDIYNQIRYDPLFTKDNGRKMYGVTNTYEMVAELANPEFREALKKKSLLQRILDAVKSLFGIEATNAYDSVSAAFDKLMTSSMDDQLQSDYESYMRTQKNYDRFSVAPEDSNSTNPYEEGSLQHTVFEMLNKADSPQELQDWVNGLLEEQKKNAEARSAAPVIPSKDKAPPINKVQRGIQRNQLDGLIKKYGALPKGEKPQHDTLFPAKTSEERYTRRLPRTAAEAGGTPQRMTERIEGSLLTDDALTYARITDTAAIAHADREFDQNGYRKTKEAWAGIASADHNPTKYDIALGERLFIEAARNDDDATAMKVLADLSAMATQAGQVVQASRLLKKLGPVGQLYYVQKAVDRLNKQNDGRIAKGTMAPILINKDLAKAVILSETTEEMTKAMDTLIQDIADQLPVTLKDKWDAWRYLAMLGNPRTHVRNYIGNAVFTPVRFAKDLLAAAGERMFLSDPSERTKDAGARLGGAKYKAIREFAKADFQEMEPQITGTGKMNPLNEIMDKRKIFKRLGFLNKISDFNDFWLNKEDIIFLEKAYVNAMTQFIAARGLTLEELSGDGKTFEGVKALNEARAYAALEAQKATYRDFSRVATALNNAKRAPGIGWLIDGLMPFTKTPINILKRGVEYSPVGLAKALSVDLMKVKRGDLTAAEAIDHAAAGMTGTGVALLGWLLASLGLARGGGDDDDKKESLDSAEGHQNYSLEIGGVSYTIDWAAPVALPFFVGVEAFNQLTSGGQATFWDFANALTLIAEPMMSLSMLDGVNSTLAAVRYGDSNEAISSVVTNMMTSYISQAAPTLFGQIARTVDPDRRSTYVDKNTDTPAWLQRFAQGVQGKIPGAASEKMAYIDTWGRKDTNKSMLLRGIENFISPGYANRINETPIDIELERLYESTGNNSVLPGTAAKYFQVEGETLNLNAKQYEEYKTVTGQTAFKLLGELMDDVAYISMDDEQKAAVVEQALKISTAVGKQAVAPTYKADNWIQRAIEQDNLETAAVYHALSGLDTGLSDYQLISAMDWLNDEDRGKLIMSEHTNTSRNMTDYTKKKYKFVLTDEQIKREREIYESLFWSPYADLISSQKFINADVAGRADLISKMQSSLGEAARRQLGDELRAAGYTSVLLDDSDVPEQVANLYDLLNRG